MKEYYKLSSKDLSQDTIKGLRWTSSIGLASMIFAQLMIWSVVPANIYTGAALALAIVIGFIAIVSRLPNYLFIPTKHLDEWGRELKLNAESFTYRVFMYFSFAVCLIGFAFLNSDVSGLRVVLTPTLEQVGLSLFLMPFLFQYITTCHLAWNVTPLSKEDVKEMYEIEKPRKIGKWSTGVIIVFLMLGVFGGKILDSLYMPITDKATQTCVITMETEIPTAQIKHLHNCKKLEADRASSKE
jgi:hypothetical protein